MDIKSKIRTIPDHPIKGIKFRDISTLLSDADGLQNVISQITNQYIERKSEIDYIAGIESRGFVIGSALAYALKKGFIMIRKPGKLPGDIIDVEYELEYGTDKIEIQADAFDPGSRILLVDDLIATGGTIMAAINLIEKLDGVIVETAFVIDLPELGGSKKIIESGYTYSTLTEFSGM